MSNELVTLANDALIFATPYIIKSGEKIAENIGDGIYNLVTKLFQKDSEKEILNNYELIENQEKCRAILLEKISQNKEFENELRLLVDEAKVKTNYNQQVINNIGNIEKQVNIGNVTGNIEL